VDVEEVRLALLDIGDTDSQKPPGTPETKQEQEHAINSPRYDSALKRRLAQVKEAEAVASERQEKQAKKMRKMFEKSIKVEVGSYVSLKLDYRDISQCDPSGVMAVVFDVKKQSGGVRVVCEHGVIGMGQGGKQQYWAPYGTWKEKSENLTVSKELKSIREMVKAGNFNKDEHKTITLAKAQEAILGHKLNGRGMCRCKNHICGGRCGCRRDNRFCTSACHCRRNCSYTAELFKPAE
jgi:hypothetical protein